MRLLSKFFGPDPGEPGPLDPPRPEGTLYVVGDLHGRADLLERILHLIAEDIHTRGLTAVRLVFVGDYIDRGEDSATVLARLRELGATFPDSVVCLLGNHERMLLDFLDDPAERGARWLKNGGLQTLASFGLRGTIGETVSPEAMTELSLALADRLPAGLEDWLRRRPLIWHSGNVTVVHAGVDPERALDDQPARTLIWGHRDTGQVPHRGGGWIAHGHTVVEKAQARAGYIAVDTGAVYTERLSAAVLAPDAPMRVLCTI